MSVKILRASDPVTIETLILLLYGDPGSGKTTAAFSAAAVLLFDFDKGAHRSHFRGDSVPISTWQDVVGLTVSDLAQYKTIVIDTVGRLLDVMAADIIRRDSKMGRRGGGLTLQGFGALKAQFAGYMNQLRDYGLDIVLVAHGTEGKRGDDVVLKPEITGSSYGEVFKQADGVGRLCMQDDRRVLSFSPCESAVGKNPAGLEPIEVPNMLDAPTFLADLISQIKDSIGQISAAGQAVVTEVAEYRGLVDAAKTAVALTKIVNVVNDGETVLPAAVHQIKVAVMDRAKEIGVEWDAVAEKFAKPKKAEAPMPAAGDDREPGDDTEEDDVTADDLADTLDEMTDAGLFAGTTAG